MYRFFINYPSIQINDNQLIDIILFGQNMNLRLYRIREYHHLNIIMILRNSNIVDRDVSIKKLQATREIANDNLQLTIPI